MKQATFLADDDLRQAAQILRQRMLDSLPAPEDCHYEASPELQEKIHRMIVKDRRRMALRKIRNRAAAAVLCILVGVSAWLAVDTEAHAALFQWARELCENNVVYRFFNPSDTVELPEYEMASLPEGYREVEHLQDNWFRTTAYADGSRLLIFSYQKMTEDSTLQILSPDGIRETVQVSEMAGDFYLATQASDTNELIWVDEDAEIIFSISAFLGKDELVALAENVVPR